MDNLFLKYMRERTGKRKSSGPNFYAPGPVITISRDYGCPGRRIARLLSEVLTEKNRRLGREVEWKWMSKEIIEESARELKLSPTLIQDLSDYRTRGFFENLALFFSDEFYPGDVKIKNTIARFIYNAASQGNVVIVGRAGESITKNFEKALHVKLKAPLDWRTEQVANTYGMSLTEAKREAIEMDKRRSQFRNYFEKDRPDIEFFDMFFNCATMSDEEIIEMILIVAETRGFV
ncbi:cytidylate kinase-like family protein [Natronoflexus pectinivorans]|uniref:Cytidylate kinase n=1 Tax=Natronoflexus pectinivorans TaxID=682526 RepID=A0A4R2GGQ6_9BACT|nr:cytidylate kinase-like family protein [Natronoflexus pectinivorans]TCO07499.1 cytidylate kinase [Natronoflexus pectinivorans]